MPSSLQNITGTNQTAQIGTAFPNDVVVRALDAAGNPLANTPLGWGVPTSGPSGTFPGGVLTRTANTDASGYGRSGPITANNTLGSWIGAVQIVATPTVAAGFGFTNVAPAASSIAIPSNSQNLTAAPNSAFAALQAYVTDGAGNPQSGVEVTFNIPAGHGTFTGGLLDVTANTNSGGMATAPTFTANATTGSFTVTAHIPSASVTTTWSTIDPSLPTTVSQVSGNGQQAAVSSAFAKPLKVKVTNGFGDPVTGVQVTFTSPSSGASCTFPALTLFSTIVETTDVNGVAQTAPPLANAITGSYYVTATVPGTTAAQFQLTNGVSFQPEVCTTAAAPTAASNQGAQSQSWANPGNAISGGNTGSIVTMLPSTSSKVLLCAPASPAALAPIDDGAKITKFVFTYDANSNRNTGIYAASVNFRLYDGSTGRSSTITGAGGIGSNTWESKTQTISNFTSPTTITGAQLKAGNFGAGFSVNTDSNTDGTVGVRKVTMSICYQNPNTPPASISVPLQMCEV